MKTAVCLIVKNEEAGIGEWLAYHIAIGFDSIIVFDNGSTDRTTQIVDEYSRAYNVRRINWTNTSRDYQKEAYDRALGNFGLQFDWMCFIDSDEFLVPLEASSINEFLHDKSEWAALAVNWAIFGSSGHEVRPDGLMIESFLQRSEASFGPNRHVKSIVQPGLATRAINPHFFEVHGSYMHPQGQEVAWQIQGLVENSPVFTGLQVNHYFVRSKEQWAQKIRRGYHDIIRLTEEFDIYDRNEVPDTAILRFVPKTREIMASVEALPVLASNGGLFQASLTDPAFVPTGIERLGRPPLTRALEAVRTWLSRWHAREH